MSTRASDLPFRYAVTFVNEDAEYSATELESHVGAATRFDTAHEGSAHQVARLLLDRLGGDDEHSRWRGVDFTHRHTRSDGVTFGKRHEDAPHGEREKSAHAELPFPAFGFHRLASMSMYIQPQHQIFLRCRQKAVSHRLQRSRTLVTENPDRRLLRFAP